MLEDILAAIDGLALTLWAVLTLYFFYNFLLPT